MWPFDEAVEAINGLIQVLPGLMNLVLYPFLSIQDLIYQVFAYEFEKFYYLFNNLMSIPTMLLKFFEGVFVVVLPGAIIALFGALFLIVVGLRLYSFLKDISIAGFKI